MTIAGYAIIGVVTVISMVRGHASLLTVRITGASVLLLGSPLLGVIIIRARLLPWWRSSWWRRSHGPAARG
jgi:hypothetical protein